jgi:2-oxo-4-hydroxy-4-carboxy--5-ureidoimidazoline (OHCU) decarboxylase
MIAVEEAFEGATPLALKVKAAGPYRSPDELIARARAVIPALTDEEKVATLNAHPRIGEDPKRLSARSLSEQGAAALAELQRLNEEYERRFGFRFVIFVDRRPKSAIVKVLQQRLRRSRAEEMAAGLQAIVDIAQDRLRA